MKNKDFASAMKEYNQIINEQPTFAEAIYNRGIAFLNLGMADSAETDFKKVTDLQPENAFAFNNLGLSYRFQKKYTEAINSFTKAIALNEKLTDAYFNRAQTYELSGDLTNALPDYKKVKELLPEDATTMKKITLIENKLSSGGNESKEKKVEIKPEVSNDKQTSLTLTDNKTSERNDSADFYNKRGIQRRTEKDLTGAIKNYNKALFFDTMYVKAYYNRAIAKSELEDYRGALIDYDKVLQLDKNFADAYYNRGISRYKLGRRRDACLDFSKAGELGVSDAYELIKEYCK